MQVVRYSEVNEKKVEDIVEIDIELKRKKIEWLESMNEEIEKKIDVKMY